MLRTIVFYFTLVVVGRTYFSYCLIVRGPDVNTCLFTKFQSKSFKTNIRCKFSVSVAVETVGVLTEFVILSPPVRVVEACGTEQDLLRRVGR